MLKSLLKKALPHAIAVTLFVIISLIYFSPILDGYVVRQHDIQSHKGVAKEIIDYRNFKGEEVLWTNSTFSGMPATQISVHYKNDVFRSVDKILTLGLKRPASYLFMYMLGFYILLIALRLNPWLAITGAIAYGFSSYFFILMGAGHNTKAHAVSYMAPALAGFLLVFRKKVLLGGALFAFFMGLLLRSNHVQIAYYLSMVFVAIFIWYAIQYVREKAYMDLLKSTGVLGAGSILAVLIALPILYGTYEYAPYTMRGGSELTVQPNGQAKEKESGLDLDYITQWSYGHQESWSFLIPNIKGGSSMPVGADEAAMDMLNEIDNTELKLEDKQRISQSSMYWGNQRFTSGPVYIGAIICYLFLMALIFVPGGFKWSILAVSFLAMVLAWGNNAMGVTQFFMDNFPMYAKFRAVTIALVVLELTFPLLAFYWLKRLIKNKESYSEKFKFFGSYVSKITKKQMFLISSGIMIFILILFVATPGSFFDFSAKKESAQLDVNENLKQLQMQVAQDPSILQNQFGGDQQKLDQAIQQRAQQIRDEYIAFKPKLESFRQDYFKKDATRSLLFVVVAAVLIFCYLQFKFDYRILTAVLGLLILGDLWPVANRYMNNDPPAQGIGEYKHWQKEGEKQSPVRATPADQAILVREQGINPEILESYNDLRKTHEDEYDNAEAWDERLQFAALGFNTNYKVLDMSRGLTDDGVTPYFHKSISGYHAAKLRRYQDIIEFFLMTERSMAYSPGNLSQLRILNMLNTKYIILRNNAVGILDVNDPSTYSDNYGVLYNSEAYGNAWFTKGARVVDNPNQEIMSLRGFDTRDSIIVGQDFKQFVTDWDQSNFSEDATITLASYAPNHLVYDVNNLNSDQVAVFSEIYYPVGWNAYVDGKKTDHFRANYILRALKVPAGAKKVEFKYELNSYNWTTTASLIGGLLTILSLLLLLVVEVRSAKTEDDQA